MSKQNETLCATALLRKEIPNVLKSKEFKDGATFDQLWDELFKNKKLSAVMVKGGKKRLGLLQGLTNRIKDNKEENILLIKKEDGKNYYIYYDNSIDKLIKTTDLYISSANKIEIDKSDISKEKQKALDDIYQNLESLMIKNKKIIDKKDYCSENDK